MFYFGPENPRVCRVPADNIIFKVSNIIGQTRQCASAVVNASILNVACNRSTLIDEQIRQLLHVTEIRVNVQKLSHVPHGKTLCLKAGLAATRGLCTVAKISPNSRRWRTCLGFL